ncbi:hypothetical protein BC936DRAFT_143859, partial [Jimgerdemannia flammicorona]
SVEQDNYIGNVYAHTEGLTGILISDKEYSPYIAFLILNKFIVKFSKDQWKPNVLVYPELSQYLEKYQDPKQADNIMRVQKKLDETKIILHKTIESILQYGKKLESLIEQSDTLSNQSKCSTRWPRRRTCAASYLSHGP